MPVHGQKATVHRVTESDVTERLRTQGGKLSEGGVLEMSKGSLSKVSKQQLLIGQD